MKDQKVGEYTIDVWRPKDGGSDRVYSANFGQDYERKFTIRNRFEVLNRADETGNWNDGGSSSQAETEETFTALPTVVKQFVQK